MAFRIFLVSRQHHVFQNILLTKSKSPQVGVVKARDQAGSRLGREAGPPDWSVLPGAAATTSRQACTRSRETTSTSCLRTSGRETTPSRGIAAPHSQTCSKVRPSRQEAGLWGGWAGGWAGGGYWGPRGIPVARWPHGSRLFSVQFPDTGRGRVVQSLVGCGEQWAQGRLQGAAGSSGLHCLPWTFVPPCSDPPSLQ